MATRRNGAPFETVLRDGASSFETGLRPSRLGFVLRDGASSFETGLRPSRRGFVLRDGASSFETGLRPSRRGFVLRDGASRRDPADRSSAPPQDEAEIVENISFILRRPLRSSAQHCVSKWPSRRTQSQRPYFGGILVPASRRMVSPFSIWFSQMVTQSRAYSSGWPKRVRGKICDDFKFSWKSSGT